MHVQFHRLPPRAGLPQQQVGLALRAGDADQQVVKAVAVHVAGRAQPLTDLFAIRRDEFRPGGCLRAVQRQVAPHRSGAAKDEVDAVVGRVANQKVVEAVAVHVSGGGHRVADPGPRQPHEGGETVGQHLGIRRRGPPSGAAIDHGDPPVAILSGGQPHRQVRQPVPVKVAQPGHVDPIVIFVNSRKPQPDGGVLYAIECAHQLLRAGGLRDVAHIVGYAVEGVRLARRDVGRVAQVGAVGQFVGRGNHVHDDGALQGVAFVARPVEGAHGYGVLALGGFLVRQYPVGAPVGRQECLPYVGPDFAPGLAVGADLHAGDAGEIVAGVAGQGDGDRVAAFAVYEIAILKVESGGGRGVVHGHLDRVGRAGAIKIVVGGGGQIVHAIVRQVPGVGPGAGSLGGHRPRASGQVHVHTGHPTGGVVGRAADHVGADAAAQHRAVRRRDDGDLWVIQVHRDQEMGGDVPRLLVDLIGQGGDRLVLDRSGQCDRDRGGDGGADYLPQLERVCPGEGPGHAIATRESRLSGRRAVAAHLAALDVGQKVGQAERQVRGDGLRADALQRQGHDDRISRLDVGAGGSIGVGRQWVGIQREARRVVVGVRTGRVGALAKVVQAVVVGVGVQRIRKDPHRLCAAWRRDLPAAHPLAVRCLVVDFFAVVQAVAVRVGLVNVSANAKLDAVIQAIVVAVRVGGVGTKLFL